MTDLARIVNAAPLHDCWVRLWFSDGLVEDVDIAPLLDRGDLFAAIREDRGTFEQVAVNEEAGTIEWPGAIDLDPDVLHGRFEPADGPPLVRRVIEGARG